MESINSIIIAVSGFILAAIIILRFLTAQKARQKKESILSRLEAEAFECASEFVHDENISEDEFYECSVILSKKLDAVKALKSDIGM
ncbi:MAG: hypothetical protein I8H73_11210 [Pseudomonadales bacterium]|nr:hypothetical protein [Pseudomonadales bacterium]